MPYQTSPIDGSQFLMNFTMTCFYPAKQAIFKRSSYLFHCTVWWHPRFFYFLRLKFIPNFFLILLSVFNIFSLLSRFRLFTGLYPTVSILQIGSHNAGEKHDRHIACNLHLAFLLIFRRCHPRLCGRIAVFIQCRI